LPSNRVHTRAAHSDDPFFLVSADKSGEDE
jgi:hypothetical protein